MSSAANPTTPRPHDTSKRDFLGTVGRASSVAFLLGAAQPLQALAQQRPAAGARAGSGTVHLRARDITGAKPCIIDKPGHYVLEEDVAWSAADANARAITIAADNVTLDLNDKTLQQINPPTVLVNRDPATRPYKGDVISGNVAIWAEGRTGLCIRNGSVLDIQGVGIVLKDSSSIELVNLNVHNCGGNGVVNTSFLYRNGGIFVMGTKDAAGNIRFATDIRMSNCVCTHNTSALDYVVTLGSLVLFCDNVEVKDCLFHHTANSSPQPSGVQFNVVGIDFVICRNVLVQDCEANDNTSGGEPAGFFAWGENYKFLRCRANRNFTLKGNRACGFNVSTSSNLEMIDCEADGNYNANPDAAADAVKDFSATGFRIGRALTRGLLQNCRALGNYSVGRNAPAAGFMLHSTSDMVLHGCVAIGNRNASGAGSGTEANNGLAAGFLATVAFNDAQGKPVGGVNNSFIQCVADGNTVDQEPLYVQTPAPAVDAGVSRGDPMKGAGFILRNQKKAKLIACQALNNHGQGIWLQACGDALVEDNLVATNTHHGIRDDSPAGRNIYVHNAARLNGNGHADNYVGLPPGTPVSQWSLGSSPVGSLAPSYDNTSISAE